jgi:hypothetical protein
MIMPTIYNIPKIPIGASWEMRFQLRGPGEVPIDVSECSGSGAIRPSATSSAKYADIAVVPDGEAAVDGWMRAFLTDEVSSAIRLPEAATAGRALVVADYDIRVHWPDGTKDRVIEGTANLSPGASRG